MKEKLHSSLWLLIFFIFAGFLLYKISDFLAPFFISFVVAYFLNPLVNFLHLKIRISRAFAAFFVIALFILLITGAFLLIAPAIYARAIQIVQMLPGYFAEIYEKFYPKILDYLGHHGVKLAPKTEETSIAKIVFGEVGWINKINDLVSNLVNKTIESGSALIEIISLLLLAPVMIFYLLKDWEIMITKIQQSLPEKFLKPSKEVIKLINENLSAYARGQINVCLILALFYGSALFICGLESGFAIGVLTGLLAFIPYVGFGIGMIFAFLTALLQWGFGLESLIPIVLIFVVGQVIESNFLVPLLIGKKIGLHPLWLIFGLFFFGCLFGITGIIFSVPLTATFAVLVKYTLRTFHQA